MRPYTQCLKYPNVLAVGNSVLLRIQSSDLSVTLKSAMFMKFICPTSLQYYTCLQVSIIYLKKLVNFNLSKLWNLALGSHCNTPVNSIKIFEFNLCFGVQNKTYLINMGTKTSLTRSKNCFNKMPLEDIFNPFFGFFLFIYFLHFGFNTLLFSWMCFILLLIVTIDGVRVTHNTRYLLLTWTTFSYSLGRHSHFYACLHRIYKY